MPTILAVAAAGALGTLARYGLDSWLDRRSGDFPWGIFLINVSGAFLLGVAVELMRGSLEAATWFRTGITAGLLAVWLGILAGDALS